MQLCSLSNFQSEFIFKSRFGNLDLRIKIRWGCIDCWLYSVWGHSSAHSSARGFLRSCDPCLLVLSHTRHKDRVAPQKHLGLIFLQMLVINRFNVLMSNVFCFLLFSILWSISWITKVFTFYFALALPFYAWLTHRLTHWAANAVDSNGLNGWDAITAKSSCPHSAFLCAILRAATCCDTSDDIK